MLELRLTETMHYNYDGLISMFRIGENMQHIIFNFFLVPLNFIGAFLKTFSVVHKLRWC